MTWQQGLVFAFEVFGIAAAVAMATAAVLHLTYVVVRRMSGD